MWLRYIVSCTLLASSTYAALANTGFPKITFMSNPTLGVRLVIRTVSVKNFENEPRAIPNDVTFEAVTLDYIETVPGIYNFCEVFDKSLKSIAMVGSGRSEVLDRVQVGQIICCVKESPESVLMDPLTCVRAAS